MAHEALDRLTPLDPLLMLRNAGQRYRIVGVLGGSIAMTEWSSSADLYAGGHRGGPTVTV